MFTAHPDIVKFPGFETRMNHTRKLRLVNTSKFPQRLHILPPTTTYFKIHYAKKGMIPAGMSEDIYV